MKETITLSQKDQARAGVLTLVLAGQCTVERAATLLGRSARQVRRLKRRYADEGVSSLVHGNRGRAPANAVSTTLRATIAQRTEELIAVAHPDFRGELRKASGYAAS